MESAHTTESERLRRELTRLRGVEEEARNSANRVTTLQEELEKLRKELQNTRKEKKAIEDWAQTYQDEMEQVRVCFGVHSNTQSYIYLFTLIICYVCKQYLVWVFFFFCM